VKTESAGTRATLRATASLGKPSLVVSLGAGDAYAVGSIRAWLNHVRPSVLNVAGNRESVAPGIGERVRVLLVEVLKAEGLIP
jgi:hypothetical protein